MSERDRVSVLAIDAASKKNVSPRPMCSGVGSVTPRLRVISGHGSTGSGRQVCASQPLLLQLLLVLVLMLLLLLRVVYGSGTCVFPVFS